MEKGGPLARRYPVGVSGRFRDRSGGKRLVFGFRPLGPEA
jgi:hypothetical protein